MPRDVKKIRVFLSSPGDLSKERELIRSVCEELSHDLGGIEGFAIELVRWETHSFSALGDSPQDIINEQIGQDYDIFLGMLGLKFGTATRKFGSGTEEEFSLAVSRNKQTGSPEVMFFFYGGGVDMSSIDAHQLSKIQEFRKGLSDIGLLYFSFKDEFSLYRLVHSQLHSVIRKVLAKSAVPDSSDSQDAQTAFDPLSGWQKLLQDDSEVNASVLMQMATQSTESLVREIIHLTKSTGSLIKSLKQETTAITKSVGRLQPENAVKSVQRLVASIRSTNQSYLEIIPRFHTSLMEAMSNSQRSISVFSARGELNKDAAQVMLVPLSAFRTSLESLSGIMETTEASLQADLLPGTAFSVEIRKFRALINDLKRVLEGGVREMKDIENTLSVI